MLWTITRCPFTGDCDITTTEGEYREVAKVRGFTPDEALSRACLIATAPDLHHALSDLIAAAKKELPEHIWDKLKHHEDTLRKASELYERHRQPTES